MKFKLDLKEIEKIMFLIVFTVCSFWVANNLEIVFGALKKVLHVLLPFILGGVIAFILNIIMVRIENVLKKIIKKDKYKGMIRTFSIVLSLLFLLLIFTFILFLLIPELINNVEGLIKSIPNLIKDIERWILDLVDKYPDIQKPIVEAFNNSEHSVSSIISMILNYFINSALGFISDLVSGFATLFTAVIFSIYMLSQKEYLIRGFKKALYAYVKEESADKIMNVLSLANNTFSNFISGQCVEAGILGLIMFGVLKLFNFPYALIISVLTAVTALIPIFGAMIAMAIGAVLICISNPVKALLFIAVFQVVQQIENNFIYPKVVGKSVGLSPMWTLLAITAGGSLFGIVGMIIGLPVASVTYAIVRENIINRLKSKKIKVN